MGLAPRVFSTTGLMGLIFGVLTFFLPDAGVLAPLTDASNTTLSGLTSVMLSAGLVALRLSFFDDEGVLGVEAAGLAVVF